MVAQFSQKTIEIWFLIKACIFCAAHVILLLWAQIPSVAVEFKFRHIELDLGLDFGSVFDSGFVFDSRSEQESNTEQESSLNPRS